MIIETMVGSPFYDYSMENLYKINLNDKYYYFNQINFYNERGVYLEIKLNEERGIPINPKTTGFFESPNFYNRIIKLDGEIKRKIKFKLDKNNFIYKNSQKQTYYHLFIYQPKLDFIGNCNNNYYLYKCYKVLGCKFYIKTNKSLSKKRYRLANKILNNMKSQLYGGFRGLNQYLIDRGVDIESIEKDFLLLKKYDKQIKKNLINLKNSPYYSQLEFPKD